MFFKIKWRNNAFRSILGNILERIIGVIISLKVFVFSNNLSIFVNA